MVRPSIKNVVVMAYDKFVTLPSSALITINHIRSDECQSRMTDTKALQSDEAELKRCDSGTSSNSEKGSIPTAQFYGVAQRINSQAYRLFKSIEGVRNHDKGINKSSNDWDETFNLVENLKRDLADLKSKLTKFEETHERKVKKLTEELTLSQMDHLREVCELKQRM